MNGLYDPSNGDPPLGVQTVAFGPGVDEPERTNYFTVYRIKTGAGRFWADAAVYPFGPNSLLFFVPYQHIRFEADSEVQGELVRFHANFLCVETFHAEVGCAGILFNDPYGVPVVHLDDRMQREANHLFERIHREQHERGLAHSEVLLAYLKILLVLATRLKSPVDAACPTGMDHRHPVIASLAGLIEQHYCTLHAPADYARLLHMTPKTLGRIVREQLGKSLTDLIQARLLTHAKWQLLHTLRPVKEIAREIGFRDELYFSRLFKKATGCSPTFFREFETEIRGGSNLSMFSAPAPILPPAVTSEN
jgi:AraC-like DNA-binding protein